MDDKRLNPDPIKLAFADRLADAALAWYRAAKVGDMAAFMPTTEQLMTVAQELNEALTKRERE